MVISDHHQAQAHQARNWVLAGSEKNKGSTGLVVKIVTLQL